MIKFHLIIIAIIIISSQPILSAPLSKAEPISNVSVQNDSQHNVSGNNGNNYIDDDLQYEVQAAFGQKGHSHEEGEECLECDEFFHTAWRTPETIKTMQKQSYAVWAIFITASLFRIYKPKLKKTTKKE